MDWFPSFAAGYIVTVVVLKILAYIIVTFCPLIVTIIFTVIMVNCRRSWTYPAFLETYTVISKGKTHITAGRDTAGLEALHIFPRDLEFLSLGREK